MLLLLCGASNLAKSLRSRRHRALIAVLVGSRKDAGLTQRQVAVKWKRPQSTVAAIESGARRLDVVEFCELAAVLGVDPVALFERFARWR